MRQVLIAPLLALSACAPTPPPAIEVRTVTIDRPVAIACIHRADLPTEPALIGDKLTGDAARDLNTVAASAVRLRAWGRTLGALLGAWGRTLGALLGACVLP